MSKYDYYHEFEEAMIYTVQIKTGDNWVTMDEPINAISRKDARFQAESICDRIKQPVRIIKAGNVNGIVIEK